MHACRQANSQAILQFLRIAERLSMRHAGQVYALLIHGHRLARGYWQSGAKLPSFIPPEFLLISHCRQWV
jgi:hypothetical protein